MLEPFDLPQQRDTAEAWHLFAEASRLAYADRDRYIADPDFMRVPTHGLVDPQYLRARARLIDPEHAYRGRAAPGEPPEMRGERRGDDASPELPSTSNIAVVDAAGDAVDMTTTIEHQFGSHLMVRGFLLNNELTDFSFLPERDGAPVANRVEGGKRPRSAMAPTLVFDQAGRLVLVLGSAGGPAIITDVAKTLVAVLDWGYDLQRAMDLPNIGNRNGATEVEATAPDLAKALRALGHDVVPSNRASGLTGIRLRADRLEGGADPRREGVALGD
jgi:gamma-glutamyltranspeptidase/glutathione hydrolase